MVSEQPWPASWAKTSFLAHSPPLCLRRSREGVVTGALKCSPSDQQLRGVRREEGRKMWVFPWPIVCLWKCVCACVRACVPARVRMLRLARWNIRLTAIIHVYHCSAPHSFLFVPSSRTCFHSVWSTAEPCRVLLLTNQTSQCHWAALSKTHGHVSSLHSLAFQHSAGSQAKEVKLRDSLGLSSARPQWKKNQHQEVNKLA